MSRERAWRICRPRPTDINKLYALHAPEVECIGKDKARQPYVFGVKVSLASPRRPTVAEQLEQTSTLLQDVPGAPRVRTMLVDLGFRGVDAEVAPVQVVPRGKTRTLPAPQQRWLERRQASGR